ncbi:histidyl-tRNA synthetase [Parasphingorhabdus marina DSM 22363]|uniref:Histidine--tRNA ligase n=1 Tax=Parasphingorhabdus marina DSM 22363 TaxID=1123272 RepID=A0A1N6CMY8_9SPHN|nr:histidine--tRNA ligase [Parasphingorhabdus marina]SIN59968.1 histidyl-tRNA synthetase [Parasphingorhabdus marina DSM 22363]
MAKVQTPQPVRGTQDIFGEDQERFRHVVDTFERVRRLYGFKGVEMPVFEPTAVFARSLGETTDVVSKEMYSFEDRGGDSLTLRPEFTAGLSRAFLTNGWQQHVPLKLSTHGPLFRYERPQKGRYRQFHQLDAEIIGAGEASADVELLCFADQLLRQLGIDDGVTLQLNTLGDAESRDAWRDALVEHFRAHEKELSEDSRDRLERNPLRILDSKERQDRPIADSAPDIDAYLSGEAKEFFAQVTEGLDACGVKWERNSRLVRGLDYYRHTAFEFVTDRLGAQGTVLAGGRYDGLIEALGGNAMPAVGWAAGIERLAMLVEGVEPDRPELAVLPMGDEAMTKALSVASELRGAQFSAEIFGSGKFRKRMTRANQAGALAVVIIGEDELASGKVQFKNLATGEQSALDIAEVIENMWDLRFSEDLGALGSDIEALEQDVAKLGESE